MELQLDRGPVGVVENLGGAAGRVEVVSVDVFEQLKIEVDGVSG